MTTSGGGSVSPYTTKTGRKWEARWRDDDGASKRKKGFSTKPQFTDEVAGAVAGMVVGRDRMEGV